LVPLRKDAGPKRWQVYIWKNQINLTPFDMTPFDKINLTPFDVTPFDDTY
jgi:hypothetical protein